MMLFGFLWAAFAPLLLLAAWAGLAWLLRRFAPGRFGWRGALLPNHVTVVFDILEPGKRPVNAVADHSEVKSVVKVTIRESRSVSATLLFDAEHGWDERILAEQFRY